MQKNISSQIRNFEIIAVILTAVGKIVFVDILDLKFYFIITTILFWFFYSARRIAKDKSLVNYWGLSFKNSKSTFRIIGIAGSIAFLFLLLYGLYYNTIKLSWNMFFVLISYPLWGLVQQFLTMSLFAGNLKDHDSIQLNHYLVIILTSILFAIVHYPSWPLIGATFVMAVFYSIVFLKHRNIIPLGLFHGILGGLYYYFVLNRDPWAEFIKNVN